MVLGFGFGFWFRVLGFWFQLLGFGFRVWGFGGLGVWVYGFKIDCLRFLV